MVHMPTPESGQTSSVKTEDAKNIWYWYFKSGFKNHVIETTLFSWPLGDFIVSTTTVSVAVILLVVWNELSLLSLVENILLLHVVGEVIKVTWRGNEVGGDGDGVRNTGALVFPLFPRWITNYWSRLRSWKHQGVVSKACFDYNRLH